MSSTYSNIVEEEGSGSAVLAEVLRGMGKGTVKITSAQIKSTSPLKIRIDNLPDLLDDTDVTMLDHIKPAAGDRIMMISADGGANWVALGKVAK